MCNSLLKTFHGLIYIDFLSPSTILLLFFHLSIGISVRIICLLQVKRILQLIGEKHISPFCSKDVGTHVSSMLKDVGISKDVDETGYEHVHHRKHQR